MTEQASFTWKFHRIGGLDQLTLRTAEELRRLEELDPKLWVALSCPVDGLQFDARTLELLDADADGRIRMQDVLDAVRWTTERLRDPASLAGEHEVFSLDFLRTDGEEGTRLAMAARRVLENLGKAEMAALTQEDVSGAVKAVAQTAFNGDGIMPDRPEFDAEVREFIRNVLDACGGVPDAGGEQGVDLDLARKFMELARTCRDWSDALHACATSLPSGVGTPEAFVLFCAVREKLDDYFIRCRLAEFEPGAEQLLNAPENLFAQFAGQQLNADMEAMAGLPLARIAPGRPLSLLGGLNPAWMKSMNAFCHVVLTPLLGAVDSLNSDEWEWVKVRFAPYEEIMARKPDTPVAELPPARLAALLDGDAFRRFETLVLRDQETAGTVALIGEVERLVVYHRHLHRLLMNFVSFCDFYAPSRPTTFQIGTLYIDGRSCELCVRVDDIDLHAQQAQLSRLCLVYCRCVRKDHPETLNIAAAVTAGNSTLLTPGRHGVFVDRSGTAWDATLIRLVDNPISIRTAMSAPYRRMGRMLSRQVEKLTAAKDESVAVNAAKSVEKLVDTGAKGATAGKPAPFDIGRSMGIFAAIGLALGALGTALASIAAALLALSWWQFPLLLFGIFLCISGPSMLLAWLSLRQRTLGPVLDASGWAVNSRIPVNFMMGRFLTASAALPRNVQRSLNDPFKKTSAWKGWMTAVVLVAVIAGCCVGGYWGWKLYRDSLTAPVAASATVGKTEQEKAVPEKDSLDELKNALEALKKVSVVPAAK